MAGQYTFLLPNVRTVSNLIFILVLNQNFKVHIKRTTKSITKAGTNRFLSYCRQLYTDISMKNYKIKPKLIARSFGFGFDFMIFQYGWEQVLFLRILIGCEAILESLFQNIYSYHRMFTKLSLYFVIKKCFWLNEKKVFFSVDALLRSLFSSLNVAISDEKSFQQGAILVYYVLMHTLLNFQQAFIR